MLRSLSSALLALLAATAVGCASEASDAEADDPGDDGSALIHGEVARAGQFPATLYFQSSECTAAKIAPKVVLTAAHCVFDVMARRPMYVSGDDFAYTRDPASGQVKTVKIDALVIHPTWQDACTKTPCVSNEITAKLDASDVAVLKLKEDLPDVKAARIDDVPLRRGDRVVVLGYGCEEGVMGTAPKLQDRKLKFSETSILAPQRVVHEGSPLTAADVPTLSASYVVTGGPGMVNAKSGLCPGDSGGPVYRWRGAELVVVGVNSNYTFKSDDTVGLPVTNLHTRLDAQSKHGVAKWLRDQGAAAN